MEEGKTLGSVYNSVTPNSPKRVFSGAMAGFYVTLIPFLFIFMTLLISITIFVNLRLSLVSN